MWSGTTRSRCRSGRSDRLNGSAGKGLAITDRLPADTRWRVGHPWVLASFAAFTDGEPWLDRLLATLVHRRDHVGDLLGTHVPSISWELPEAAFLA
jgi:cysteine-S-conjugate beta-lyase